VCSLRSAKWVGMALSLRSVAASTVLAGALTAGCGNDSASPRPAESSTDLERGQALISGTQPLPARAEVVALAHALAVASSKAGRTEEGTLLAATAAKLRELMWRREHAEADGREALELYRAAIRTGLPSAAACEYDRARATLTGELAGRAEETYRALYIAIRRQESVKPGDTPSQASLACITKMQAALGAASPFRPSASEMVELAKDADHEASIARQEIARRRGTVPLASATITAVPVSPALSASASAAGIASSHVVVAPTKDAVGGGPVKLTSIQPYGSEDGARIVIQLSAPDTFDVGTLPADGDKDARIYLDIAGAKSKGIKRDIEVGGAVRRVRVGARKNGTRVVLDIGQALYRRIFYLPSPFRIVIDVSSRPPSRPAASAPGTRRSVRRVVLDPGHGGEDSGAIGPTGLEEKDVTLEIAHSVATLLTHELKVSTLMTRDKDVFVPLDARTAHANAYQADLFISIHCNASEDGVAHGVQTYVLDPARNGRGEARRLASLENATRVKGRVLRMDPDALDSQMSTIVQNLGQGGMLSESRHFASLLQTSALASLSPSYPGVKDGGVYGAGFFVLVGADMPAALFETSFISNPEEEQRLADRDYKQKLADAIVNAVRAYQEGK